LVEATFDRSRFNERLTTRRLGRTLLARASVDSTNDVAWEALADGLPDGTTVVADQQTKGRGRAGRSWHTAPGLGLALSVGLHPGCDREGLGLLPLVAGLALGRALDRLGVATRLKWPNDVLWERRKLAGVLCEARKLADGEDAVVIGVGVNVGQRENDLPPELRELATSLALAGCATDRESVAAEFLDALEPLWDEVEEGGHERVLGAWKEHAGGWGELVTVRTPTGPLSGRTRDLDPTGALVLEREDGRLVTVWAGDVEPARVDEAR
jgi:BirA family biotin operon repressor/biotin-[acetyl-CoA-carboxylase] ligase